MSHHCCRSVISVEKAGVIWRAQIIQMKIMTDRVVAAAINGQILLEKLWAKAMTIGIGLKIWKRPRAVKILSEFLEILLKFKNSYQNSICSQNINQDDEWNGFENDFSAPTSTAASSESKRKSNTTMKMQKNSSANDFEGLDIKAKAVVAPKTNNVKSKEEQDAWEMLNS